MLRSKDGRFIGGYPDNMRDPVSGRFTCVKVPLEISVDLILSRHGI